MKVLISTCLLGVACKYSGGDNACPALVAALQAAGHELVPVCPEVYGGLPTPRTPAERIGSRVVTAAGKFIIEKEKASIGMLQRMFKIGFNRAARIMDQLCDAGVVGPEEGTKPRKVLMSAEEFENYLEENGG